jgi:hypothetical protein
VNWLNYLDLNNSVSGGNFMPNGTQNGVDLKHLKVQSRLDKSGEKRWHAELHIWVADPQILEVDQALQILKTIWPEASISELACTAIITAAKKAKRARARK